MTQQLQKRIRKMFLQDAVWAYGFVVVLWIVVLYVFFQITALTESAAIDTVLTFGAGFVLLFNTAAIVAMVKHYSHEKDFIYGLDIRHLDKVRAVRAARKEAAPGASAASAATR